MKLAAFELGIPGLDDDIKRYITWEKNDDYKEQVRLLVEQRNVDQLQEMFGQRLHFGTAGLRAKMGPGFNRINEVTIIQTAQGLYYNLMTAVTDFPQKGIVVGYDGRYNSKKYAELTAAIFLHQGVRARMFSAMCPTPYVAWAIRRFGCGAGIMVTASHNPKEDNGYKVYNQHGAQIIPPQDKEIQEKILKNLRPWDEARDFNVFQNNPLFSDPLKEVVEGYLAQLEESLFDPEAAKKSGVKFTYTAMHGVGYTYMKKAFEMAGFRYLIPVEEQKDPDPEFSTVKFPNPEEGKSSLELSIQTADANGSKIILANDPDADRLAVAEKLGDEWKTYTGNELGALLGWWLLKSHCIKKGSDLKHVFMLSSAVSSKILMTMAKQEGFSWEETLTGFKWMGNRAMELREKNENNTVIFAFEEAIGFMCGSAVVDKDGISAGIHIAEMAVYLNNKGRTLNDQLQKLYLKYGFHLCKNSYYVCHKPETTKSIFERLRNFGGLPKTYPTHILDGKYKVKHIRDLTIGYDSSTSDFKPLLPTSSSSQMITFSFENGLVLTLRTSGTEPKIKYYSEFIADQSIKDSAAANAILEEMVSAAVVEFLQPELNGIVPKSD